MPFLVRLGTIGRSKERYQWSPNKDYSPHPGNLSRNHTDPIPRRGHSQPYSDSPPSYSQVQSLYRREVAETRSTGRRKGDRRQPTTTPLTSTNLASLNGEGPAVQSVHVNHRISHVSQYPAQPHSGAVSACSEIGADDFPRTPSHGRHPSTRRPTSLASTGSTVAVCLAVGQLPGSEPFDLAPPSQDVLRRHSGVAAQPQPHPQRRSSTSWLDDARGCESVYQTAAVVPVRSAVSGDERHASSTSVHRVSVISAAPSLKENASGTSRDANNTAHNDGSSSSNGKKPTGGFPQRLSSLHAHPISSLHSHPVVKTSGTWPMEQPRQQQRERQDSLEVVEPHPGHRVDIDGDDDDDVPPPPPPKDPGYVSRPPGQRQSQQQQQKQVRRHSSTPNLSSVGLGVSGVSLSSTIDDGKCLLPHSQYSGGSGGAGASRPLGRRASARNRLGSLVQGKSRAFVPGHRRFFSLRYHGGRGLHGGGEAAGARGDVSFRERSGAAVHKSASAASSANRRSQMAVALTRFLGRALPKSSVLKGS